VTTQCAARQRLLQSDRAAQMLLHVLYSYAAQKKYLLHQFVVMPNHVHLILTPNQISIERAMQFIKGGFSHAFRQAGTGRFGVWQHGFSDRRLRNFDEYMERQRYTIFNPVRAGLCSRPEDFPYSSANPMFKLDPIPQRLKPASVLAPERHG
jgi:putative transposase